MKIRIFLATATAASVLMTAAALANDTNEAYTGQQGNDNVLVIQQGNGPGNNRVGTTTAPILQKGDNNFFREQQQGGGGYTSMGNNVIDAGKQEGDENSFNSSYNGNSSGGNTISDLLQQGDENVARVHRNSGANSLVGTLHQIGSGNWLTITQTGNGNEVTDASQIGDNNGASGVNQHNWGTYITQNGSSNKIALSRIEGSDNNPSIQSPGGPVHLMRQTGNNNGQVASIASTLGSNGNWIHVIQNGDANNFNLMQGLDTSSTQNSIHLLQTGDDNMTTATQYGSYNRLNAEQTGNDHVITANVTGDNNGSGVFTNAGASGLASSNTLTSGDVFQDGLEHTLTLNITSSNNQFAFLQTGGSLNSITATVSGTGGNQTVGVQDGSNNTAGVTQAGGSNVATFNQVGDGNSTTISQ